MTKNNNKVVKITSLRKYKKTKHNKLLLLDCRIPRSPTLFPVCAFTASFLLPSRTSSSIMGVIAWSSPRAPASSALGSNSPRYEPQSLHLLLLAPASFLSSQDFSFLSAYSKVDRGSEFGPQMLMCFICPAFVKDI